MKPLTTSIFTFSNLITDGFLYVDKSAGLYELIKRNGQYFLARPRRFGKSLMISTLKAIFQGKRELFKGFAIDKQDYDWQSYPVIHLDMGSCAKATPQETEQNLIYLIKDQAKANNVEVTRSGASACFQQLVTLLSTNDQKVVILVDEYDKPLLNHIGQESVKEIQSVLKSFYSVIKTTEPRQRFAMITGVSKFSKVSIFSDLNNLTDLTMSASTATLLGYTQEELKNNFDEYTEALAEAHELSKEECLEKLKGWYNGYKFEENAQTVYNPVSVMKCFQEKKFKNFWFETGTPTFLIEMLKNQPVEFDDLALHETSMDSYDPENITPLTLLFQTGYLTIESCDTTPRGDVYHLRFPNNEVDVSFNFTLARAFSATADALLNRSCVNIVKALKSGAVDAMLKNMSVLFSQVPHDITLSYEKYYQSLMFFILKLLGTEVDAEVRNHIGRMDCLIKTDDYIYVIEFKLNGTAEEALQQIEDKQYALPYANDPRKLFKVGVEFSKESRNIDRWLVSEG